MKLLLVLSDRSLAESFPLYLVSSMLWSSAMIYRFALRLCILLIKWSLNSCSYSCMTYIMIPFVNVLLPPSNVTCTMPASVPLLVPLFKVLKYFVTLIGILHHAFLTCTSTPPVKIAFQDQSPLFLPALLQN